LKHILALIIVFTQLALSAQEWELKKIGDGIRVYTGLKQGSDFKSFKAEMKVNRQVDQVKYILQNVDLYPNLFPDTKELKILKRPNDSTLIQYSHTETPWPIDDRDGVYQVRFKKRADGGFIVVGEALPNYLPEKEDIVRIKKTDSLWEVIPQKDGTLKIIYTVSAEPGGKLPDWLVNSAVVDIPFNTFTNLKATLKTL
jgi:hypothetical protein